MIFSSLDIGFSFTILFLHICSIFVLQFFDLRTFLVETLFFYLLALISNVFVRPPIFLYHLSCHLLSLFCLYLTCLVFCMFTCWEHTSQLRKHWWCIVLPVSDPHWVLVNTKKKHIEFDVHQESWSKNRWSLVITICSVFTLRYWSKFCPQCYIKILKDLESWQVDVEVNLKAT